MPELMQLLLSGVTVGAVYALVALGFTIIYNASDVVNFAQGEFVMLGGMITVFAHMAGLPLPLSALIAALPGHHVRRRLMSRAPWNNWFAWQPICSRNRPLRNGIVAAERRKM